MNDTTGLDPYREEELRQALATDARVGQADLQVRVQGGRVTITGSLPTEDLRRGVEDVLADLAGDLEIDDQIVVAPLAPGGREEDVR